MPEMPEVETIARRLRQSVIGKRIEAVTLSGFALRKPIPASFPRKLQYRTIARIHRRGKYLVAELEPRAFWVIHLGMSGRLLYSDSGSETEKHVHASVRFADSSVLHYRDHRRFGLMAAHEVSHLNQIPELATLGKDPLGTGFSADWFWPMLQKSRQEIKSFLLDQRKIAGLGNIYVCESLYRAKIHPGRRCHTLSRQEAADLRKKIRSVLRAAIRSGGTSFSDFMDVNRQKGRFQHLLRVYQREGARCRNCRASIARIRHSNRSSFICPRCQPEPE